MPIKSAREWTTSKSGFTHLSEVLKTGVRSQLQTVRKSGTTSLEVRELRQLRDENARLKRLVADLTLDRHILQEVVKKKI